MNIKQLQDYCEQENIKLSAIDYFKSKGAKNANQVKTKIDELKETVKKIDDLISTAEYLRNAYFFNPPSSASGRRSYEKTMSVEGFEWHDGKDVYYGEFNVSCSCKNVYARGYYEKNDKRTTLKAVKTSYGRLASILYE